MTAHVDGGLALLPQRDQKPNIQAILSALLRALDATETAAAGSRLWRDLATTSGASLDVLGRILRLSRNGTDEEYRAALRARIRILHPEGTPEALLGIARAVLGATAGDGTVRLEHTPPACFTMHVRYVGAAVLRQLVTAVRRSRSGGVRGTLVIESSDETPWRWDYAGLGYSHTDGTHGGAYAHVTE